MRYYQLVVLGLLVLAAGSCKRKQAAPSSAPAARPVRPHDALFPIVVRGRWGFIDSTGAVVIAPRFAQVRTFAAGLALARETGRYGYIDKTGQFVLPPRYADATPFRGDVAMVYTDSTLQLIDRAGRQLPLPASYKRLEWYTEDGKRGFWVGSRADFKSQLLTARGQVLNPTWFKEVGTLSNNRLVVSISAPATDPDGPAETELVGAVDGQGRLVIPYHRFDQISTFRGGLATATLYQRIYDEKSRQECIIDTTGRILACVPSQTYTLRDKGFSDGVLSASLITSVVDKLNPESYPVALDRRGQPLFRHPGLRFLGSYGHNRAWASGANNDGWHLLDKTGRPLTKLAIESVLDYSSFDDGPAFADGVELVKLAHNQGYAALDTTGRVVSRLHRRASGYRDPERRGSILAFYADSAGSMGFWNWRTGLTLEPRFSAIDPAGYQHGLLAVVEDHRLGYLSPAGRYVWREAAKASAPLNLDYQRRSYYAVASPPLARHRGFGGWAPSGNLARPITPWQFFLPGLTIQVAVASTANAYAPFVSGHTLHLANASADTVVFNAQDSGLYLTLQALTANGRWRDIEYTPSSFCGNSYHQVFLAPGQYWQVVVPAYAGARPTLLRARLLVHGRYSKQQKIVYSNAFVGSVNPAQYWQQQGHSPQDIMDPYFN